MRFLICLFFVALGLGIFNGCSGAASKRAAFLGSLNTDLPTAEEKPTAEDKAEAKKTIVATEEGEQDNPKEFNYFPYDLQLDTIAFMSVIDRRYRNNDLAFNFKAGAYFNRSGLRLSSFFLKKKDSLSAKKLKALIKSSTKYQVIPWLSIAPRKNYAVKPQAQIGYDLSDAVDKLITNGLLRLRSIRNLPIEARLNIGINNFVIHNLNSDESSDRMDLVLSYKGGEQNQILHKTGWEQWGGEDMYARVYNLSLKTVRSGKYILSDISEEKYPEKSKQPGWKCPESLIFEIRSHSEQAWNVNRYYERQPANYKARNSLSDILDSNADARDRVLPSEELCPTNGPTSGSAYEVAKKVLGTRWNINTTSQCVSPAHRDYRFYVEIDRGGDNRDDNQLPDRLADLYSPCSRSADNNFCPHILSICVRKN